MFHCSSSCVSSVRRCSTNSLDILLSLYQWTGQRFWQSCCSQNTMRGGILRRTTRIHVFALTRRPMAHFRRFHSSFLFLIRCAGCSPLLLSSFSSWWCYEIRTTRNVRKPDVLLSVEFSGDSRGKTDKRSWEQGKRSLFLQRSISGSRDIRQWCAEDTDKR